MVYAQHYSAVKRHKLKGVPKDCSSLPYECWSV